MNKNVRKTQTQCECEALAFCLQPFTVSHFCSPNTFERPRALMYTLINGSDICRLHATTLDNFKQCAATRPADIVYGPM